jgi:hypothetical protein
MKVQFACAMAGLMVLVPAGEVLAQVAMPYVPPEIYQERRWVRGNELTFCVWDVSPTAEIDRRIAEEIGNALLLEVKIYEHKSMISAQENDFWEAMLIQLGQHCDAVMGLTLGQQIAADWLIPSRPYYEAPYVLAVTNPDYQALNDIPSGQPIASTMFSAVDDGFIEYLSLLPAEERWVRYPMPSHSPIVDFLTGGRVEGALIWAPLLQKQAGGDPDALNIRQLPIDPVRATPTPIGFMMREYNVFLRDQLDQAIRSLSEDGVIDDILAEAGLPGSSSVQ